MGGSRLADINAPSNLLHLCEHCHGDIESHRSAGYVYGWLVHRWDVPLSVPLKLHHGAWVFLDDLGRYVSANPEGVAA